MKYIFKKKRNKMLVTMIDGIGLLFKFLPKPTDGPQKTVAVLRLDHVGDVLMATAVPKVLKEFLPKSRLVFVVGSWAAPLLENNPFVDDVVVYDAPWFAGKRYRRAKGASFLKTVSTLKKMKVDLGLGLRGDLRENVLMAMAGMRERIGYGVTGGGFLLTRELTYRKGAHHTEHTLDILGALGAHIQALEPKIYYTHDEENQFRHKYEKLGLSFKKPILIFHVDAGSPAKDWPLEHWSVLLNAVSLALPLAQIVLVGGDVNKARQMQRGISVGKPLDLSGRTTLRELAWLLKEATLVVGADSGPAHIAAAQGTRTLFLYSATNVFDEWKPLYDNAKVLRDPVPCALCESGDIGRKNHPCMMRIRPEQVLEAIKTLL